MVDNNQLAKRDMLSTELKESKARRLLKGATCYFLRPGGLKRAVKCLVALLALNVFLVFLGWAFPSAVTSIVRLACNLLSLATLLNAASAAASLSQRTAASAKAKAAAAREFLSPERR